MFMERIRNDSRDTIGRFVPTFDARPPDFAETFVRIGRVACEEHYHVGRLQISKWLEECGKAELKVKRVDQVKHNKVERDQRRRLNRRDMKKILDTAYPAGRYVNPAVARRAAHHLRIVRNGGWIVSPMSGGLWRLGQRVVSAEEVLALANAKGFGANLPGDRNTEVD